MKKAILYLLTLIALFNTHAALADNHKPCVIVLIAGSTSIRDFTDPALHNLNRLLQSGSVALMNVRTGKPGRDSEPGSKSGFESGCLCLGAGAMGGGGAEVRRAGNAADTENGENIGVVFKSRTNMNYDSAEVLHTEIAKMQRINDTPSCKAKPGALGTALHQGGIRTAVIGNSDLPAEMHREAVTTAMDSSGIVDMGAVGFNQTTITDPQAPYGFRTDPAALIRELDRVLPKCRLIVIDFGDTYRADAYSISCTDPQSIAIREQADHRLDEFIPRVLDKLDLEKDLFILLSPNARTFSEIEDERLASIVMKGPGFGAGMLISPSTRRPGVVTLTDVAPTILAFLGIEPVPEMIGRPVRHINEPDTIAALQEMNLNAATQSQRQVTMRGASVAMSSLIVLITAALLLISPGKMQRLASWLILSMVAIPLVMLYLPIIYPGGLVGTIIFLVLLTLALITVCALVFRSPSRAFVWLCGIMLLSLAIDLMNGAYLISKSVAGYGLVEGARYYGIGNELMGVMLGAAIAGMGLILSASNNKHKTLRSITPLIFIGVFIFISAPMLGANVGGALATAPAIAVALMVRRGWKPSTRGIVLILIFTVLIVGSLFALDSLRGGVSQSHVGRTMSMARSGAGLGILSIIERKLTLNIMLVSTSLWSRLLGIGLVGSALLWWWGKYKFGVDFFDTEIKAAAAGCLVGTIGAFIFNDSGVVAAATCVVFLWALPALKLADTKG